MHGLIDFVGPAENDGVDNEGPAPVMSAQPRVYYDDEYYTNHIDARSHAELEDENTGVSVRDQGLSIRRPMQGVDHNDQFPYRGDNPGYTRKGRKRMRAIRR